jgi:hypothetical protein
MYRHLLSIHANAKTCIPTDLSWKWCNRKSAALYLLSIYWMLRHAGTKGKKLEFMHVLNSSEKFCYDTSKVIRFGLDKLFFCAHFRNSRNPLRLVIGCCKDIRLDSQVFIIWYEGVPHLLVSQIREPCFKNQVIKVAS